MDDIAKTLEERAEAIISLSRAARQAAGAVGKRPIREEDEEGRDDRRAASAFRRFVDALRKAVVSEDGRLRLVDIRMVDLKMAEARRFIGQPSECLADMEEARERVQYLMHWRKQESLAVQDAVQRLGPDGGVFFFYEKH
eukprot:PhM_4_TR15213/c2_g1_i4/m.1723